MSWHYIGTTWMSAKCQHSLTLLKFRPTNTGEWHCADIFPWQPMYPNVSLDETVFTHIAAVGKNHFVYCDVTGRSRQVSTSMFFGCLILIFKQIRNISIKRKCLSMTFNKYTTHVLWLFSLILTKSQLLEECQRSNVMRLMSWHLTQNLMRFALWDGKPMSWF